MSIKKDSDEVTEDAMRALKEDSLLGPVIEEHGPITFDPATDVFRRLVHSIVSQQVSTASATAIRERLFDAVVIEPESVLEADEETLRDVGLSRAKVEYVRNVAEAFIANGYDKETFAEMTEEEIVSELTQIKGVGIWTVKMQLIFTFGRPDVFPVEDLGVRNGMETLFGEGLTQDQMVAEAERWKPYRSYASLYLWRVVD